MTTHDGASESRPSSRLAHARTPSPRALNRATLRIARAAGLVGPSRLAVGELNPIASAQVAHCRYVDDAGPGIQRRRAGKGFTYVAPNGATVRDPTILRRIRSLAIPPAWTSVWICPDPAGHIQATGRDARGRKQYRYHARFREIREETKYARMISFAEALPTIRAQVDRDLGGTGLSRDRILATVVRLLEITLIRIGNEEYARDNGSFGLTTMRTRHVDVHGSTIEFHFRGKSGKTHIALVRDRRLARIVHRCNDLPGEVLFQYVDDGGELRTVEAADVNEYLRRVSGADFTAKDFRTWAGTVLTAHALAKLEPCPTGTIAKKNIVAAVRSVSARLGNTPSVCRKCYVHPEIFGAYLEGELHVHLTVDSPVDGAGAAPREHERHREGVEPSGAKATGMVAVGTAPAARLATGELAVLALLRRRLLGPPSVRSRDPRARRSPGLASARDARVSPKARHGKPHAA